MLPLLFLASAGNFECGRWAGRGDRAELLDLARAGVDQARHCAAFLTQQIADCAEDINERSKLLNELAAEYCAERVTGCRGQFRGLTKRGDSTYECRCGATF